MRKTLGVALAMALIVPGPASADLFNNLKLSGKLDTQSVSAHNVVDFQSANSGNGVAAGAAQNDRISNTLTRVLLTAEWDLLDDVHSQVSLRKNNRTWGGTGGQGGNQAQTGQRLGTAGTTDVLGSIEVDRANVTIDKMMGHFDVTLGRQWYGEPGDLIWFWGPKDTYGLNSTAIDAVRFRAETDMFTFDGLQGQMNQAGLGGGAASLTNAGGANTNLYVTGIDLGWKNMPMKANTFLIRRVSQASGGPGIVGGLNDNLYVLGAKLRGEAMGGWLSLDLAANAGENRGFPAGLGIANCVPNVEKPQATTGACPAGSASYNGYGLLLDTGYNAEMSGVGGVTPWATFGLGSGRSSNFENTNENFTTIASDFRPGVINRKFNSCGVQDLGTGITNAAVGGVAGNSGAYGTCGLTNRVVWGLGTNFTPAFEDRMTVGLSLWDFSFHRNAAIRAGESFNGGSKHIGSELGLTTEWRHSENVTLGTGYARFLPGGAITSVNEENRPGSGNPGNGINPVHMFYADFSVKF